MSIVNEKVERKNFENNEERKNVENNEERKSFENNEERKSFENEYKIVLSVELIGLVRLMHYSK